ncbi:MAG: HYR domain-containing protein [Acidobacteriota bacterium]|nr:HYR domain-containing protein [Acidobacteriota bacterium]
MAALVCVALAVTAVSYLSIRSGRAASGESAPSPSLANPTSTVFINEILYDINGTDAGEFIEVAAPAGTNMANYSIVLYNGSGGAVYDTDALSGTTTNQQGGYGTVSISYPSNGIQNGAPDGIALINTATNTLVQFLCYEGTFVGVGGLANGVTCTDIGVSLSGTNAAGTSLQLQGTGTTYGDFTWNATSIANTQNAPNTGQTFGGGGGISLSINDVTQAEGDPPGTTTFTFAVTLTTPAGAGGVTFDIATADGTAQDGNPATEDNDYVAQSLTGQTIPAGSSGPYNFSVTVNRDTTTEPNETFFVNVTNITGAIAGDVQGQGTINNDDVTLTAIHDIQGPGASSPVVGASVTTRGIVTGVKSNGFFIQEPDANVDANPATSEGIFVFTSSAPPAAAVIGALVQVAGTVVEFVPSADPQQPPLTELSSPTVTQLSTGNPLPTAIPLTATFPDPTGTFDQLERVEGMRVSMASMTVGGPTLGNVNEPNATATTTGVFFGTVTGVARAFREAGIQHPDVPPSGTIPPIPRFDTNPEVIRVDSDGQTGGTAINVSTTSVVTGLIGPLDYGFRHYTILPDPASPPMVSGGMTPTAVATPMSDEVTIASYNLERFFDDVNDPGIGEPVLTTTAYQNRLAKASLGIRDFLKAPDIVGIVEVENLSTLQALATKINNDAVANSQPNPMYVAFLVEGNDVGGIDVGFLVKTAIVTGATPRVTVNAVVQELDASLFTNPDTSTETLHDRPPLRLDATVNFASGASFPVQVIVNHLRSLNGIDDAGAGSNGWATDGDRVRAKRLAQVVDLANLVQTRQTNNSNERIVLVGDFNFFEVNDGYVDSMSTLLGAPVPDNQTVVPGDGVDLVTPDLTLLLDSLLQRYSFVFDGNAQSLDHAIINAALIAATSARRVEHARINADFPETDRNGTMTVQRLADHDPLVVYLKLQTCTVTCPSNITTVADAGQCSAVVNFSPTIGGTCGTVTCSPASGTAFSVGTTTVTCSQAGGSPSCSFTVTVTDNQNPTISACPTNQTANAGANCTAAVTFATPTATDNCGATVTCVPASGANFPLGVTTVTCTARDAANNTASCSFTVTVNDMTAPSIGACPSNQTASAGANCTAPVTFSTPTANDNCTASPTVACSPASGSSFALGVTTVTCTATDAANNSSSCSFTVTVNDVTPPTISCPGNQAAGSSGGAVTVNYPAPTAMDNCTATPTVTCNPASGSSFPVGVTTVSCTARDAANNPSQACSFTVTVTVNQFTPAPTVSLTDPLVCTGPGNRVNGSFAVTNTSQVSQTGTITVVLPAGLVGLPNTCTANVGTCSVTANSVVWNGTLTAGQTITANYQAQIGDQVLNGAQLCAQTTAVFGQNTATVPACLTATCPAVGPGSLPSALSPVSDQKSGSVLIYNVYTSSTDPTKQNTRINLTNTHPSREIQVHLYFVAEGCSVADSYVCLTPNQTTSFITSDFDPGTTGYIVAVATNQIGCPINFNYLIGDEYVKFSSGHAANLGAEAISAIAGGLTACDQNSVIATLNFDGVSYNQLPRALAASNVASRADGNDTMLIVNRIGGNLGIGAATLGTLFGIFYDDAENGVSFTVTGSCQLRGSLSNNFPRTTPRFEQLVPAGRSGWLRLYRQETDIAMLGATINFNPNSSSSIGAFNQGHNLHKLTLSSAGSYVIPVFPPPGC